MQPVRVKLTNIITDAGTQTRAQINQETVTEYAEFMKNGAVFPAIIVFKDGEGYLLADGSHRLAAAKQNGVSEILADVRDGTRSDAIKFALAANTTNGLRRTNADKRNCVEIALKELTLSSNRAIAELCAVSDMLVADVRRDQGEGEVQDSGNSTHTGKDGKKYPAKKLAPRAKKAHRNGAAAQVRQVRGWLQKVEPDARGMVVSSIFTWKRPVIVPSKETLRQQFEIRLKDYVRERDAPHI